MFFCYICLIIYVSDHPYEDWSSEPLSFLSLTKRKPSWPSDQTLLFCWMSFLSLVEEGTKKTSAAMVVWTMHLFGDLFSSTPWFAKRNPKTLSHNDPPFSEAHPIPSPPARPERWEAEAWETHLSRSAGRKTQGSTKSCCLASNPKLPH